jgi:hypothetical protein
MADTVPAGWVPPGPRLRVLHVAFFIIANAIDCLATIVFTRDGAQELNPLVQPMLSFGASHFVVWKMSIAATLVAILAYRAGRYRSSWRVLKTVNVFAAIVTAYYLIGLSIPG